MITLVWTAVYFELVNKRLRERWPQFGVVSAGPDTATVTVPTSARAERGFVMAIVAASLLVLGAGPISVILGYLALRSIKASGIRYGRGAATAMTAIAVGLAETVLWVLWPLGVA